jgi:hypothetical protein
MTFFLTASRWRESEMMRKKHISVMPVTLAAVLLLVILSGCGKSAAAPQATEPAVTGPELLSIPGTWQTASMGYADDGSMQPEYYVRFSDSDILYGHLKNGQFVLDHSDKIVALEETPTGGFRVQAQASNGAQYTFRTCESDDTILEYYETWREEEFAEMYRGGASLSRCS